MRADDFVFDLPEALIAGHPAEPRDASRLMVVPRDAAAPLAHRVFRDIREYLRAGDLLVVNNSRVIPARLFGTRPGGGISEMLLLEPAPAGEQPGRPRWIAMVRPARKARPGDMLDVGAGTLTVRVVETLDGGERLLEFTTRDGESFESALARVGHMPLPPYILRRRQVECPGRALAELDDESDRERYQTVYAREGTSVAAPTAGLHFTQGLLDELRGQGIGLAEVTLNVGAGTFVGMAEGTRVEDHPMHQEWYCVPDETAAAVAETRARGGRVVAVGTTSVRTLESAWDAEAGVLRTGWGSTRLMIKPGYSWGVIDAMITNFHLPRSTLLLLVSAFIGRDRLLAAYADAITRQYRFFSYGDAMFLEGRAE